MRQDYSGRDVHLARIFFPVIYVADGDKFRAMEHWSERLRAWMQDQDMNGPELARISGVSEQSIYKYLRGRTDAPRGDVMSRLAGAFGKTEVELMHGVKPTSQTPRLIPLLKMADLSSNVDLRDVLSNWRGPGVLVHAFQAQDTSFALEVADGSCAPIIDAGSTVVVDTAAICNPGDYVLAYVSALKCAVCRRYRPVHAIRREKFSLIATNPDFPQIDIDGPDDGYVIGRVMKVMKDL